MSKAKQLRLVNRLVRARRSHSLVGEVENGQKPASLEEAYAMADAVVAALGAPIAGYKVGATSPGARAALGIGEPFWGAILAPDILNSPARLDMRGAPYEVEPEIAFRLKREVALGQSFNRTNISELIETAFVALEINRPSYREPFVAGALCIIADKGANRALVQGPGLDVDADLADIVLQIRGRQGESAAASPAGSGFDPLDILCWLTNAAGRGRLQLRAGFVVATGAIGRPMRLETGDWVEVAQRGQSLLRLDTNTPG